MAIKENLDKINFPLTSYVFGIVSIVMAFFSPLVGLVLGIIGLVQSRKQKTTLSNLSKKLNIIGIVVSIVLFAASLFLLLKAGQISSLIPSVQ
ncbi:DUF4190 domain-containing protein [Candidatus Pacearchaeota archaeon]|nr:DUF4190 domain-containing protein [Candidatus Pacearchaeota archaeon]